MSVAQLPSSDMFHAFTAISYVFCHLRSATQSHTHAHALLLYTLFTSLAIYI